MSTPYVVSWETGSLANDDKRFHRHSFPSRKSARTAALQQQKALGGYVVVIHKGFEVDEVGPNGASWLRAPSTNRTQTTRVRQHPRRTSYGTTTVSAHARNRSMTTRHFTLPRGLSYKEAYRAVPRGVGDFRGFTYDPKTGRASVT